MGDFAKTKAQLVREIRLLRERLAQLERASQPLHGRLGLVPALTIEALQAAAESAASDVPHHAPAGNPLRFVADALERLRFWADIVEHSSQAFVVSEPSGRMMAWNRALCDLLGYSDEELGALDWPSELIAPESADQERWALRHVHETGQPMRYELELIHREGFRIPVELLTHEIADEQGKPKYYYSFLTDITLRKEAKRILRESEERFRRLVEHAPDIIYRYRLSPTPGYEYISPVVLAITGYTPADFYVDPNLGLEIVHPDDRPFYRSVMQSPMLYGYNNPLVLRWLHRNGQAIWIEQCLVPIYDEQGRAIALEGIVRDITVRKEATDALRRSHEELERRVAERTAELRHANEQLRQEIEERRRAEAESEEARVRLRALLDATLEIVVFKDVNSTYLDCSATKCQAFDRTRAELQGKSDFDLFPLEEAQRYRAEEIEVMQTGRPVVAEHYVDTERGKRWLGAQKTPYRDASGQIIGVLCTERDITERKLAEEETSRREAHYRSIVEGQEELICRFLPDGTLTFVNEAYCRYFSRSRKDLIGHSFMPLIPDEDVERCVAHLASLTPECPVGSIEHRVILPDGEIRWQQWTDRAIFDETGRITEFQSVGRDITERVRAEEALRRSHEELERRVAHLTQAVRKVMTGQRYLRLPLSEITTEDKDYVVQVGTNSLDPYDTLTPREREILLLAAEGYTSADIAERLCISPRTVETHRSNFMRKLNLRTQTDIVRFALRQGLIDFDE